MTAGPGDQGAAEAAARGYLRASHADREQVIGTLKAAFVQGMLAKDEFDVRVGQALASRTYADLAVLTADIPAGVVAVQPPEPARAQDDQPVLRPGPVMMAATALCAGVWGVALLTVKGDNHVAGFLVVMTTLTYFLVLLIAGGHMLASRRDKRARRGQLPPRPAQHGQAPEGEHGSGVGDDPILCQAHRDTRARRLLGHSVTQRVWQSVPTRRASAGLCT